MSWCEVTSALQNPQVASNNRPGYLPQQVENPRVDLGISQLPAAKVPGASHVPANAPFIAKASGISQAKQWNPGQVQMLAQQRWVQSQMSGQNQQLQQQYQQRQRQLQQPSAMLKQQPQPLPQQPQQSQGHSHGPGTHGPLQGTQLVKFGRDGKGLNCAELLCKDGLGHTCKHCRPGSPEGEEKEVFQSSRRVMLHGSQRTIWMQRLTSQSPSCMRKLGSRASNRINKLRCHWQHLAYSCWSCHLKGQIYRNIRTVYEHICARDAFFPGFFYWSIYWKIFFKIFIWLHSSSSQMTHPKPYWKPLCCGAMMEAKHGAEEEDEDLLCVVCLASPTRGNEKRIAFRILWHMIRMAFALWWHIHCNPVKCGWEHMGWRYGKLANNDGSAIGCT